MTFSVKSWAKKVPPRLSAELPERLCAHLSQVALRQRLHELRIGPALSFGLVIVCLQELVSREARLPQDSAQGRALDLAVIGHC